MSGDTSAILFMVENPSPFKQYEDHEAAIYITIHLLIEDAILQGENPIAMIENYLNVVYNGGTTTGEITDYLIQTGSLQNALWELKEKWSELDTKINENSLMYSSLSKQNVTEIYAQRTLRTYLETLAGYDRE
ncbi:hypothetical protein [Kordia jejudonensis]|uniref:hypothetical protein n=1 Tax=Kordia jejudonensis TaxID=1348245 RepID=UPI001F4D30E8|nr:hypothetical protein [Kordia jejudonensis]